MIQSDLLLYKKNFTLFTNRFPELAKMIKAYTQKNDILENFNFSENFLLAKNGQLTIKENNKFLHSSYSPEKEAFSLVSNNEINQKDCIVFSSFGLCYAPLQACTLYPKKTIILIEPDINYALLPFYFIDLSTLFAHQNLICLFSATAQEVLSVLQSQNLESCFFINNIAQQQHNQLWFSQLSQLIERNNRKNQINKNTYLKFGKLWLKNTCKNLPHYLQNKGIQQFKNIAKDLSACVLAAGPSLQNILPQLKQISQKSIIICVDTALKACRASGINPDFVIVVDPQYWNSKHLDFTHTEDSILITESATYPSTFNHKWKDICFCSSMYPLGKYLEKDVDLGELGAGGSVATTAWDFARFLGCTNIYMAGLDLGFPSKQTHNKGCTFEELANSTSLKLANSETKSARSIFSADKVFKKNYLNENIQTDSRMTLYAWWFESKCSSFKNISTYNLSEKSLKIPGIEYSSVNKLLSGPDINKDFLQKNNSKNNSIMQNNSSTLIKKHLSELLLTLENIINNKIPLSDEIQNILLPLVTDKTNYLEEAKNLLNYINSYKSY